MNILKLYILREAFNWLFDVVSSILLGFSRQVLFCDNTCV
jgi:hypothetical protein